MTFPVRFAVLYIIILLVDYVLVVRTNLQISASPSTTVYGWSPNENRKDFQRLNPSPWIKSFGHGIWSNTAYHSHFPSAYENNHLLSETFDESPKNLGQIGINPELTTSIPQQSFISNNKYVTIPYPNHGSDNLQETYDSNDDNPTKYLTNYAIAVTTTNPQQPFGSSNKYVGIPYSYRGSGNLQGMDDPKDDLPSKYLTNTYTKTGNRYDCKLIVQFS